MATLDVKSPEDLINNMIHRSYDEHKRAMRKIYPSPNYDNEYNAAVNKMDRDLQGHINSINSLRKNSLKLEGEGEGEEEGHLTNSKLSTTVVEGGQKRTTRRFKKYIKNR
jgi:hypothetical protein